MATIGQAGLVWHLIADSGRPACRKVKATDVDHVKSGALTDVTCEVCKATSAYRTEAMALIGAKVQAPRERCDAHVASGICDRPLDEHGQCDRAGAHL